MAKKDSQAVAELLPLRKSQSELPAPESDEILVLSLRARHPDAGRQLFDRYAPHVRRVLVRVMGPDSEILDLVHDVFVTALESVNRLVDPRALRAWLTQIAVFTARARIRRRVRGRILRFLPFSELPEPELPPTDFEASEAMQAVYRVLDGLDTDQRIAFALRFVAGMELTEVAASCGVSLATIKRRLSRAQVSFGNAAQREAALVEWLADNAAQGVEL
ncbi:MAG TPA: sigma-70 family RNA polymerase sigma factor [Polyangiaceae bacterium]|nr:sigma-70 family RNA polymerase sigma factor [Polyangiaceae bacterium]